MYVRKHIDGRLPLSSVEWWTERTTAQSACRRQHRRHGDVLDRLAVRVHEHTFTFVGQ